MKPCPTCWTGLAAALAAAAAAGCAEPAARDYAIVLTEPPYLDCVLELAAADVDTNAAGQLFANITTDWRNRYDSGALPPTGATLHTVRSGDSMFAWLYDLTLVEHYGWAGVIHEGEPHDGYIEVESVIEHDMDAFDPNDFFLDCGVVIDSESELMATLDGGEIEGRIRRTENTYFASPTTLCGARVSCVRNIALVGAEE